MNFIKGLTKKGEIVYYDGCHNPYNIFEEIPTAFSYQEKDAVDECNYLNEKQICQIKWTVVTSKEYIKDKKQSCQYFIDQNEQ